MLIFADACVRDTLANTSRVCCFDLGQPTLLSAHVPYSCWRARWNARGNLLYIDSYAPLSPCNMHTLLSCTMHTPLPHVHIHSRCCPRCMVSSQATVHSSRTKII